MNKFIKLTSNCLVIKRKNIDTDQIIPARFLKTTDRKGLGKYLFYHWRYAENGQPKKTPYFNYSNNQSVKILVAGDNFGCGSSREHAVWALLDFGFIVIISSSFGDIFYNNALKNGLLPVILKENELTKLFQLLEKNPKLPITVDLNNQVVKVGHYLFSFPIDQFRKLCLLKGKDELGYILSKKQKIEEFERKHKIYITY